MAHNQRRGSTLIEYMLIAAVISVVVAAGANGIGASLSEVFSIVGDALALM